MLLPEAPVSIGSAVDWYADWQSRQHVERFDHRAQLRPGALVRNFESYNDVRLLKEGLPPPRRLHLLEVGCATGEFYRYLRLCYHDLCYAGLDISQVAISRASEKYSQARFGVANLHRTLTQNLESLGFDPAYGVVYSKDVLHHQADPWLFLGELLLVTRDLLILRTRTRDRGQTVLDPEISCQYHYGGWIPYIVFNLEELVARIRQGAASAQITVYRNPMVLGGWKNRHLPKACYLPETGTAETALAIQMHSQNPTSLVIRDRKDMEGTSRWPGPFQRMMRRWWGNNR